MVFGIQALQNEVFCLKEERDYFQTKFLEQISIIKSLQDELKSSKKEIAKLRQELIKSCDTECVSSTPDKKKATNGEFDGEKKTDDPSVASSLTPDNGEEQEDKEAVDIRQSAEKLLQWADYRSSIRTVSSTPDHSSVASPASSRRNEALAFQTSTTSLLGKTIESRSGGAFDDDDEEGDDLSAFEDKDVETDARQQSLLDKFESTVDETN